MPGAHGDVLALRDPGNCASRERMNAEAIKLDFVY
jgi:hypothetical protein